MATATLTVDIDYDPAITDPEAIASAADRLMETVLSTPGIMDEYGNPSFGEFFVQSATMPMLVAACRAVVATWENGDLAKAARSCAEAVAEATDEGGHRASAPQNKNTPRREQVFEILLARVEEAGLESSDLEEIVHELAASIAADVNNEGLDGQLKYLIDQMGVQGTTKQLERLVEERSDTADHE